MASNDNQAPQVSIITSVYNGASFLTECIQSILSQTYRDFEFILVDDGSTDQSWEIIQDFAARDDRIIAIHNHQNKGVVAGLNQGLAIARGEFIARQDADDVSLPNRLMQQKCFLDTNQDYGLVACFITYVDQEGSPLDRPNPFQASDNEEIQAMLLDHMCLCGPTVMLRRAPLEAAGRWFGAGLDASEDYDLCLRIAEVTKLHSLPETHYLYRQHAQSASITQEYKQVVHKAAALELALHRRSSADSKTIHTSLSKDYLWAAVLAHTRGDDESAKICVQKIISFDPKILNYTEIIEQLIQYRMPDDGDAAIAYVDTFFSRYLPKDSIIKRLRAKIVSSIHMKEVFSGATMNDRKRVKRHLWHALRGNPGWLRNKGVLAIALRYGLGKL